jgi:hypothetical protein
MKHLLPFVLLLTLVAVARAGDVDEKGKKPEPAAPPAPAAAAANNNWADNDQAAGLVAGYLQRMNIDAKRDSSQDFPVFNATVKKANATHRLRIVVDGKRNMVYLFLNRYLTIKSDDAALPRVLQRLMEKNWDLNIGKFEWDKSDGEVRFSYCFTTENGIGYEAFEAIVTTLLDTGDKHWPELHGLTGP